MAAFTQQSPVLLGILVFRRYQQWQYKRRCVGTFFRPIAPLLYMRLLKELSEGHAIRHEAILQPFLLLEQQSSREWL